MTNRVRFPAAPGEGIGELLTPDEPGKRPAVVLVHEWWGVNDQIRSTAQRWAREGFVVLVPDLYHGKVVPIGQTKDAEAAMNALDFTRALQELVGAVSFLVTHPRSNGKVSMNGYCMGGALTFAAATMTPDLAAAVPFYGVPPSADWSLVTAPIQAHFAAHDQWATVDAAKAIQAELAKHKRLMELYVYDAQHAFCNDQRPEVYNPEACALAWRRTVDFVRGYSIP